MSDPGVTTLQRRVVRSLSWMKKQREQNLDMVTDAGDASLWCKDEADTIREHMNAIRDAWKHTEALQARAEHAEAELREARMQMLSDAGQAADAYEAQLRAEAACNAVMKDRAQIMVQRDAALAQVERLREALSLIAVVGYSDDLYVASAIARQTVTKARAALAGDAP